MFNKFGNFLYVAGVIGGFAIGAVTVKEAYHKGAADACNEMKRGLEEIARDIEKRIESEKEEEA